MDDPLFFQELTISRLRLFGSVFCIFVYKCSRIYHAGTRGEKRFRSRMGEIRIHEPDG